ncbi:MAG: polysaccharide biosynthesis/export family protein [Desulfobacca sp.]|nr:polysaccharide biosynthesis/export family protein [Desulfobacca sp.]
MQKSLVILLSLFMTILICSSLSIIPALGQENYVLGPEDEIEIKVWDHEDLTRKLRVGLDGRFSYPFIGQINAQGRTVIELQKEIERRLADGYIVDPHVSITVTEFKSQKYFVIGNVQKPGTYPLTRSIRVAEAIAQAGGVGSGCGSGKGTGATAVVVRPRGPARSDQPQMPGKSKDAENINISLAAAYAGDASQNIEIKNGDTIFVPTEVVYVTGQVKRPGRYFYEPNMTVLMAVTTAEGFTDKAAPKKTYIIREQAAGKVQLKVDLHHNVKPGDTIVVPESWF